MDHRDRMLAQDNDRWFRDSFRMSRTTFCQLVALLSCDPDHLDNPDSRNPFLFNTSGTGRPAAADEIQFGTFLRFASKLTHISSARDTARYLRLPLTSAEKKEVSDRFGLSGCLGAIDGSLFKLKNEPKGTGGGYYCRTKFYGINLLAACDSRGWFIALDEIWHLVASLLVLHNIVEEFKDPAGVMEGWSSDDEDEEGMEEARAEGLTQQFALDDTVEAERQVVCERLAAAARGLGPDLAPTPATLEAGRSFILEKMNEMLA
ncbi:hypothetical protein JCM5296_002190 [Sporobolomyces johnsonii]